MTLLGDDGREYVFLLKGHEDIRQDERVMQLFGLVNTLLSTDPKTCKKHIKHLSFFLEKIGFDVRGPDH